MVTLLEQTLASMRTLLGEAKAQEAEQIGRSIYQDFSSSVPLNKGLGVALSFQGQQAQAYEFFEKAHFQAPSDIDVVFNLATLSLNMGKLHRAEVFFLQLLEHGIDKPEIYQNYINVLIRRSEQDKALSYANKAFQLYPDHMGIAITYIAVLESANQLSEAEGVLKTLPKTDLRSLMGARLARRSKNNAEALQLISSCKTTDFDRRTLAEYHNEFGLIQDKCGDFANAFSHFSSSNEVAACFEDGQDIDPERYHNDLRSLKALYQESIKKDKEADSSLKRQPAFFVGFPRSGTTLMEQMLKAHSQIVTTDERSPFEALINELRQNASLEEIYKSWKIEDLAVVRDQFWQIVEGFGLKCNDETVLVDKLPLNIARVPFIRLLFPNAPILVAYRDPRDVCLSAFIQRFKGNEAMVNFLDWQRTAQTYDLVMSVWEVAKQNLQGTYHSYKYEDLIDDYENTIQGVIQYLGLPFEEQIYSYREMAQERHIKTPSYREVVNPLNRDALGRWRNYPDQVAEVTACLDQWVRLYGYGV